MGKIKAEKKATNNEMDKEKRKEKVQVKCASFFMFIFISIEECNVVHFSVLRLLIVLKSLFICKMNENKKEKR
jgi:hypothetical protein